MAAETVLIVDDNPAILKSLDSLLRRWKYHPHLATHGKEALEIFKTEKPGLVLIDVLLPGISGLNTIQKMREINEDFTPIVMTGNPAQDFIIRSLKAGAADFLVKPFSAIQLKKSIDNAIAKKWHHQKQEAAWMNRLIQSKSQEITLMKKELYHLRKMATVGELTGGLVHEINQPLGSLILNCQELIMRTEDTPPSDPKEMKTFLEEMLDQMDLIAKIVRNMRSFSRSDDNAAPEDIDLNSLLKETIAFIGNQFSKRNIEIKMNLEPTLPPLLSHPIQIQQVVMNLLSNARDALGESNKPTRTIQISTQLISSPSNTQEFLVTIQDNGNGIPDDIKEKIFQPLFTTKDRDHGTGLGLPISREIVEELGGKIDFKSSVGEGTTFSIMLPSTMNETCSLQKAA